MAIGVASEITQRKAAEARLAHLAAIVESPEAAVISVGLNGRILTWNRGCRTHLRLRWKK
jgi:PAS domain-containing protein